MLRVEFHDADNTVKMRIEGRFVGTYAEEAKVLVLRSNVFPPELVIDVSEVIFVDAVGENVLCWFGAFGAEFVAESSYSRDVCERLGLPLQKPKDRVPDKKPRRRNGRSAASDMNPASDTAHGHSEVVNDPREVTHENNN